ncbi:hypothetical protein PanWU01x14_061740 [Parasponia andersonii]|uniref:Protein KAKU4 n=1 Tax=Parasponia andersonii TaxID=3476 RepID=A0A2P5DIB0_PARAD|nr:hypothetical protein PanWU01x14_061740 [Parasponia andersonii]
MVTNSRSRQNLEARSGGKIVRARRTAGTRATPYARPRLANSEPENPNWLSKIIFSPTRLIASGAGKLISSVFSQDDDSDSSSSSSSSSSSGSGSGSEGNVDNDYDNDDDDISSHGTDVLKKRNGKSDIFNYFRKDPEPAIGQRDSKRAIEELLVQETFTREECNKLIKIIKSRVVDGFSIKDAENGRLTLMPNETSGDMQDLRCTAVMEARKWLSAKKLKSASKSDLDNVIENEVGSPVDMAKVYMQTRPHWASPTFDHGEVKSSSSISAHLFKEETPYSTSGNALSSSKIKRDSPNTGSWNIHEEIQRVRAKATEEMLRNLPSKRIDWFASTLENRASPSSLLAGNIDVNVGEKVDNSTKPIDASLQTAAGRSRSHSHRFQGFEMTPNGSQSEASSLNRVNIISEPNQDLEITQTVDGEGGPKDGLEDMVCEEEHKLQSSKDIKSVSLSNTGVGDVPDYNDTNTNATEKQLSPIAEGSTRGKSQTLCLSAEAVKEHEAVLDGEEHNMVISSHDNEVTGVFHGETCELLSETSVEIPNLSDSMNENDYVSNGSPNGSSINNVLPRYSTRQTSKHGPAANATGNVDQQGKRLSRYNRRKQATSTQ